MNENIACGENSIQSCRKTCIKSQLQLAVSVCVPKFESQSSQNDGHQFVGYVDAIEIFYSRQSPDVEI